VPTRPVRGRVGTSLCQFWRDVGRRVKKKRPAGRAFFDAAVDAIAAVSRCR
jgi:hypothetical protein